MPLFELQGPDGKTYEVEAPDMNAAVSAFGQMTAPKPAAPQMSWGETALDTVKSLGTGLGKGAIGLTGLPGDLQRLGQSANEFIKSKTGYGLESDPSLLLPGSEDIQKGVEGVTGEFYQPQTRLGRYAETIGQFAPAALGGGGSLAVKAGRVALPAIASEAAGQATEGTAAEPYARVVAALGGGAAAHRLMAPKSAIPSAGEIKDVAGKAYDASRASGVTVNPHTLRMAASRIKSDLQREGYRDFLAPKTFRAVDELRSTVGPQGSISDVHAVRKALGKAGADFAESDAARRATKVVDALLERMDPTLKTANANYAAAKRAETIAKALEKAERAAGSANSGANTNNAIRQAVKSILNSEKKSRGFSKEELAQMNKIVKGTKTGNTARYIANLLGGGGGLGQAIVGGGAAGASYITGDPRYLAIPAVGYGMRKVGAASTARQAKILDEMVRSRAPVSQAALANAPAVRGGAIDPVVAALLAAQAERTRTPAFQ